MRLYAKSKHNTAITLKKRRFNKGFNIQLKRLKKSKEFMWPNVKE